MSELLDFALPQPVYLLILLAILATCAQLSNRMQGRRWVKLAMVAAIIWAWVFTTPGFANLLIGKMEGLPSPRTTADIRQDESNMIIILASGGMRDRNGSPHARLDARGWERLSAGIRLWKQVGGMILMTGGPGDIPDQSLAALMKNTASDFGVPANAINVEPSSTTTYEDLLYSRKRILAHKGRIWLVTSALHMPRAESVAKQLGLSVTPWRCDYRQIEHPTWRIWFPDNGALGLWSEVIHEVVGSFYYRLRGWSA